MTDKVDGPDLTVIAGDKETAKERKKREVKEFIEGNERELKVPKKDIFAVIAGVMCGHHFTTIPDLPTSFGCIPVLIKEHTGHSLGILGDQHNVIPIQEEDLERMVVKYIIDTKTFPLYKAITLQDSPQIVKAWKAMAKPVEVDIVGPHFLDLPSNSRLAYNRPKFSRRRGVQLSEIPLWAEILSRSTFPDQLCAWFGGLFDKGSSCQQYLYLHGSGGNGKSTIVRLFARILGSAFAAANINAMKSPFFSNMLIGKRLVSFGDVGQVGLINSPHFKSLTGDGYIYVERKGGGQSTIESVARYVLTGNSQPEPGDNDADMRRLVYCAFEKIRGQMRESYEVELLAEQEGILNYCQDRYDELNHGGYIVMPDGSLDELIHPDYERFDEFIHACLTIQDGHEVSRSRLKDLCLEAGFGVGRYKKFIAYLKDRHGVTYVRKVCEGGRICVWGGVGTKFNEGNKPGRFFHELDNYDRKW